MELNIFATILVAIVLVLLIIGIIIYNRNFRFKTYGVIEIIPSRRNDQELILSMESFLSNLKSMPLIGGSYNIILDITNKEEDNVNTFRIITPRSYIEHVAGIVRNNFNDFEINRLHDLEEDTFLEPYFGGFVFRTDSTYPLIKMEKEEKTVHNVKTIISSLKNGSFQIILDLNAKPRNFITEEGLSEVQIGNTIASNNINYVKDIGISFRFLSFSKSPDVTQLPSAVGGLFNLGGTSNFLTKIYEDDSLIVNNVGGRNAISNAFYSLIYGKLPRLGNFSSSDKMYFSSLELCSVYSFITGENINCVNYRRCNPSNVLRIQKESETKVGPEKFTTISEIDYPGFEGQHLKLSPEALRRHVCIFGKTGTGKSVLLSNLMFDDLTKGRGFALLDPHGDLSEAILENIPESRKDDVIFIDPTNNLGRIGLSLFGFLRELRRHHECYQNDLFKESQKFHNSENFQKIDITEHLMKILISMIKDVSVGGEAHWGSRMDSIMNNVGTELLRYNMSEIKDISSYLNFPDFRKNIIGNISSPEIFEELSNFERKDSKTREESFQSVRNRFQVFLSDSMMDIYNGESKISLSDVISNNKILIARLPKGELGENSGFTGTLLIGMLWQFAMARSNIPECDRPDYSIYIDEAQNFPTDSIASILEEARKYRLRLVMATQHSAQFSKPIFQSIIGNAGTLIALGLGQDDADILNKYFGVDPEDMMRIPPLHGYVKSVYSSDTFNIKLKFIEKDPNITYPDRITLMNLSHEKYGLKKVSSPSLRTYFEKFNKLPDYNLTKASYEYEVRENEHRLSQEDFPKSALDIKKVVAYIRTSTGPEEKQSQLEQQEVLISDYIKKLNETTGPGEQLELVRIFREQGSTNNPGREIFNQMISSIKERNYSELLCYDESRLSRNLKDVSTLNELLNDGYLQSIRIVSNDRLYTKEHPMS